MVGLKLVDASDVVSGVRKTTKKAAKNDGIKIDIVPKTLVDSTIDNNVKDGVKNDEETVDKPNEDLPHSDTSITIRAIKLNQGTYYGPGNVNKNKFMRMYKKIGLSWKTATVDNETVDGWFNKDKSQYIIKLPEEGDYKRFKFNGCDDIYNYFIDLGAVTFDYIKENVTSSAYQSSSANSATNINNPITNSTKIGIDIDGDNRFIGADFWSGYRTRQLLKDMPDNWGVIWK